MVDGLCLEMICVALSPEEMQLARFARERDRVGCRVSSGTADEVRPPPRLAIVLRANTEDAIPVPHPAPNVRRYVQHHQPTPAGCRERYIPNGRVNRDCVDTPMRAAPD